MTEETPHVEATLEKCLKLVRTLNEQLGERDDQYARTSGDALQTSILQALQIVKHESVQIPKSEREAGIMKTLAMNYLGEITL